MPILYHSTLHSIGSGEEEDDPDNLGEAPEETITSIGAANADGEVDSVVSLGVSEQLSTGQFLIR